MFSWSRSTCVIGMGLSENKSTKGLASVGARTKAKCSFSLSRSHSSLKRQISGDFKQNVHKLFFFFFTGKKKKKYVPIFLQQCVLPRELETLQRVTKVGLARGDDWEWDKLRKTLKERDEDSEEEAEERENQM